MRMKFVNMMLLCLVVCLGASAGEERKWTRAADGKEIVAKLVSHDKDSGKVVLSRRGKKFSLDVSILVEGDREYLAKLVETAGEKAEGGEEIALAVEKFAEENKGYSVDEKLAVTGPVISKYGIKTVRFQGWVPEGVKTLRGTLVIVPGRFGDWRSRVNRSEYLEIAKKYDLALMGCQFADGKDPKYQHDEKIIPESISIAIEGMAAASGHPELAFAPIAMHGVSAGSNVSAALARVMPHRVITAVGMAAPNGPGSDAGKNKKIPMLYTMGAKDDAEFIKATRSKILSGIKGGAVWAGILFPKEGHGGPLAKEISYAYLDAIIPLRLDMSKEAPDDRLKKNKYYSMLEIDKKSGYLADSETLEVFPYSKFKGNKKSAYWLPTESVAALWVKLSK